MYERKNIHEETYCTELGSGAAAVRLRCRQGGRNQKLADDGRIIPRMFAHYNDYAQRGLMPDLNPSRDNVFYYSLGRTMDGIQIQPDYSETAED